MEDNKPKKMSYEELNDTARQLSEQNQILYNKLQELNMVNVFKRLDYLFKVLETNDMFNSDFVIKCSKEITDILTLEEIKSVENEG